LPKSGIKALIVKENIMIFQVVAMASTDLLTILIAVVIFCFSGLIYLIFDHFKKINSYKEEKLLDKNEAHESKPITTPLLPQVSTEQATKLSIERAENLERAGRYEDAATKYEELKMWDKAGDCRRMSKTNYVVSANVNIGKNGTISMECPHYGASQPIATKSNEVTCKFCGKNYLVPKKVLDLL
jgi:hypothetical protein